MAWVRLEPDFPYHPKIIAVSPAAGWLWVCGIAFCNSHLTDGAISARVLGSVAPTLRYPARYVEELVKVGLWTVTEAGWAIHDYHDYQPTAAEVIEKRTLRAEVGRLGGLAKAKQTSGKLLSKRLANDVAKDVAKVCPDPVPVSEGRKEEHRGATNGSSPPPEFQIPGSIDVALGKCPTLGPALRNPRFWQAQVRSKPGVNFAGELLEAESWVVANRSRAPKKSVPAFMNRWLRRAYEDLKA